MKRSTRTDVTEPEVEKNPPKVEPKAEPKVSEAPIASTGQSKDRRIFLEYIGLAEEEELATWLQGVLPDASQAAAALAEEGFSLARLSNETSFAAAGGSKTRYAGRPTLAV